LRIGAVTSWPSVNREVETLSCQRALSVVGCAVGYFLFSEGMRIFNFNFVCVGKVKALLQAFVSVWSYGACKCAYTCELA